MERDAAISHGASAFLRERLMKVSDGYQTVFCRICGNYAVNDSITNSYRKCKLCGNEQFGKCTIPYVYKLLQHFLGAIGINLHPEFLTSEEYIDNIFKYEQGAERYDISDINDQLNEADEAYEYEAKEQPPELEGDTIDYNDIYD